MQPSLRSVAIRSLEAAGLVVYAYFIGGVVIDIRLSVAGLPSGPQMLTTMPNGQVIATGAQAILKWGSAALGAIVGFYAAWAAGRGLGKGIVRVLPNRRRDIANRLGFSAIGLMLAIGLLLVAVLAPSPTPAGQTSAYGWAAVPVSLLMAGGFLVRGARQNRHTLRSASPVAMVGASNLAGAFLTISAVASVSAALAGPTKLSMATVGERSGVCVSGPLVASTSDGAYLGDGVAHTVTLVRSETIETMVVERALVVVKDTRVVTSRCKA